jgi:DNA repair exonuclease SbcCD ATPase subunit
VASLQDIRTRIEQRRGQEQLLKQQLKEKQRALRNLNYELGHIEKARAVVQEAAQLTQQQLEYHISEIVSLALSSVFPDPYELKLEFVVRRGRTEADIWFTKDGEKIKPLDAAGGGAVDVAAFARRAALWSLRRPRTRNVLLLDEPFRFLSRDLQEKASYMLKEISDKLSLQIIMVSHSPDLIEAADKVFTVSQRRGVSSI